MTTKKELIVPPNEDLKLTNPLALIEGDVLENIRLMVTRIQMTGQLPKRLSILSTLSGEGVTTICMGVGITSASDYKARTCIVDLNWYSPSSYFSSNTETLGIADILENNVPIVEVIQPTSIEGLYILPAGKLKEFKRPEVARSKALEKLLETLDGLFDQLILDIPAVLSTSDAVHLAGHGQGTCLVIRHGVTSIQDIKMALNDISHLKILGTVINSVSFKTPTPLIKIMGE